MYGMAMVDELFWFQETEDGDGTLAAEVQKEEIRCNDATESVVQKLICSFTLFHKISLSSLKQNGEIV